MLVRKCFRYLLFALGIPIYILATVDVGLAIIPGSMEDRILKTFQRSEGDEYKRLRHTYDVHAAYDQRKIRQILRESGVEIPATPVTPKHKSRMEEDIDAVRSDLSQLFEDSRHQFLQYINDFCDQHKRSIISERSEDFLVRHRKAIVIIGALLVIDYFYFGVVSTVVGYAMSPFYQFYEWYYSEENIDNRDDPSGGNLDASDMEINTWGNSDPHLEDSPFSPHYILDHKRVFINESEFSLATNYDLSSKIEPPVLFGPANAPTGRISVATMPIKSPLDISTSVSIWDEQCPVGGENADSFLTSMEQLYGPQETPSLAPSASSKNVTASPNNTTLTTSASRISYWCSITLISVLGRLFGWC
ncbi:MAG: hypothetical protein HON43_05850 [Alphaproteobacteria bacterium]|nr:hypothetical protein [Alphaproteobacteria bacterium]MBT5540588.1 hypothetical protein [Alphaproteobacteria bacterium]